MTRQQVENIVFMTHSPLTVDEVMKAIDEYAEDIRAEERERIVRELENRIAEETLGRNVSDVGIGLKIALKIVIGGEND